MGDFNYNRNLDIRIENIKNEKKNHTISIYVAQLHTFTQVDTQWQKNIALMVELYFHYLFFRNN